MLKSAQFEEKEPSMGQEIADQIEDGMELVVEAIQKLSEIKFPDQKIQLNVPESAIQVHLPKAEPYPTPVVQVKAEFPKPNPHPFCNGLVCEIVSRDINGDIKKFTLKPL